MTKNEGGEITVGNYTLNLISYRSYNETQLNNLRNMFNRLRRQLSNYCDAHIGLELTDIVVHAVAPH